MTERPLAYILPSNATTYERTLAGQVDQILALDADAIRRTWNPWTCDAALLPYLAWSLSVKIWKTDWPESTKRRAIANSILMHKMHGTQAGIESYLDLVDCSLERAIMPPATAFAMGGFTSERARLDWLANLPQIRIYPFLTKRTAPAKRAFYSIVGKAYRSFFEDPALGNESFAQKSDGPILYGRQATFYDKGVEAPANYEVLEDISTGRPPERVYIESTAGVRSFMGHCFFGHAHGLASRGGNNTITIQVDPGAAQQFSAFSGMDVMNVNPVQVDQPRTAPLAKSFLGAVKRQRFYTASDAGRLIYDAIYILDPTVLAPRNKTKYFYDNCRFGIAPFTAELAVEIPMVRPKWRLGTFTTGYMQKADLGKVYDALASIEAARSLRDKVLVNTEIYRRVRLKDGLPLGSFKLGEMRKFL